MEVTSLLNAQFVIGFVIGGFLCAVAAFLVGRKYPKVADAVAAEANKIAGK